MSTPTGATVAPEPVTESPLRRKVQRPDYRNLDKYQFVVGYAGSGGEECVHLSAAEIAERLTRSAGPGTLVDDGVDLWWEFARVPDEAGLI